MENIFANNRSNKELKSKISKKLIWLNSNQFKNVWRTWTNILLKKIHKCQQAPEKMFNITNHQGNASHNVCKILSYTHQNGYYWKDKKYQMWVRMWGKENLHAPLVGTFTGAATMESNMVVHQQLKNRNTIQSSNSTFGYLSEEHENTNLNRYMYPYTPCSIVCNNQLEVN